MKLDHLLACGTIISAEQSEQGEKARVVIDNEIELPEILIEYATNNVNETLRLKSLEHGQARDVDRDGQEWRNIDIRLYSEGSIKANLSIACGKWWRTVGPFHRQNERIPF
jgi:hypothetical protein